MKSKHDEIRQHLKAGQTITGIQALNEFGVYRLSSIINRLRKEQLEIETSMIQGLDGKSVFAKYWIPINKR